MFFVPCLPVRGICIQMFIHHFHVYFIVLAPKDIPLHKNDLLLPVFWHHRNISIAQVTPLLLMFLVRTMCLSFVFVGTLSCISILTVLKAVQLWAGRRAEVGLLSCRWTSVSVFLLTWSPLLCFYPCLWLFVHRQQASLKSPSLGMGGWIRQFLVLIFIRSSPRIVPLFLPPVGRVVLGILLKISTGVGEKCLSAWRTLMRLRNQELQHSPRDGSGAAVVCAQTTKTQDVRGRRTFTAENTDTERSICHTLPSFSVHRSFSAQ